MKPINDNVLIKPDEPKQNHILTKTDEKPSTGLVVKTGDGTQLVEAGQTVVFNPAHVSVYKISGVRLFMVKEESIYGTVE